MKNLLVLAAVGLCSLGCASRGPASVAAAGSHSSQVSGTYQRVRDGIVYICSREAPLGSKISSRETCLTKEQAEERERQGQEAMRVLQGPITPGVQASPAMPAQ